MVCHNRCMFKMFKQKKRANSTGMLTSREITKSAIFALWGEVAAARRSIASRDFASSRTNLIFHDVAGRELPRDLISFAIKKGCLGPTMAFLENSGMAPLLGPKESKRARRSLAYTDLRTEATKREIERVFSRFSLEKIDAMLFKGYDIINAYYRDNRTRCATDIDILVQTHDYNKIPCALFDLGYTTFDGENSPWVKGTFCIDLHRDMWNSGRIAARRHLPTIPTNEIFIASRPRSIGPASYRSPDPADAFIITALHALKHSYLMDYWVMDAGVIILSEGGDRFIKTVLNRARSRNVSGPTGTMLWTLQHLYRFPLDREIVKAQTPGLTTKYLIRRAFKSTRFLHFGDILLGSYIDNTRKKLYFIKEVLFPRPSVMAQELGMKGAGEDLFSLYFLRARFLAKAAMRFFSSQ